MGLVTLTPLLVLLCEQVQGVPPIPPGQEDRVLSFFSRCGEGETSLWKTGDIAILSDRIRTQFTRDDGARVTLELRHKSANLTRDAHTPSFAILITSRRGIAPREAQHFAQAVARCVAAQDRGDFWKALTPQKTTTQRLLGPPLWQMALLLLCVLLLVACFQTRLWRQKETRWLLLELALLFALALYVRWGLVAHGPGNLYSRLPPPHGITTDLSHFGPGFHGWILLWYRLLGAEANTAFLAGAFTGALTVIPVTRLATLLSGQRRAGLMAGVLLSLWPIHALHSSTDEPFSLLSLLLVSAAAAMLWAIRAQSQVLLVAGWLAAGLAATVRPEAALALVPLAALVLLHPEGRRLQLRPAAVAITLGLVALTCLALWIPIAKAAAHFSPFASLAPRHLVKLMGWGSDSILLPPRSEWVLTALVLVSLPLCFRAVGWRGLLMLAVGLAPAIPTAALAGPDFVTARYQIPLLVFVAMAMGVGLDAGYRLLGSRLGGWTQAALAVLGAALAVTVAIPLIRPAPEPTFRLEYRFFRENLGRVPSHCALVRPRWNVDLGLGPPTHLTAFPGHGQEWIDATNDLDTDAACLVYWRPASCRAVGPSDERPPDWQLPDCEIMESSFVMEPIVEGHLPARAGFVERYLDDPVRVGFYQLSRHRRDGASRPAPLAPGSNHESP